MLEKARAAARKSRGNNGARRDMHAGMEEDVVDIINTTAKWPPNTPLEKYRDLLPDRWKPRKSL